eukprot:CAMPEP_0174721056 /NCGR_PEP_ID=MMETSP1094-20130205/35221_1 /TAXON_ID=156173 /ORGANISM="Chrysochromulina brevifilum, Strain UTEX LB 985" /LENGTH=196 /DNA_ID=CAMNT_0015921667 /DNA_START=392 /DNA_END=982 /DNA_ORIENTATION=+
MVDNLGAHDLGRYLELWLCQHDARQVRCDPMETLCDVITGLGRHEAGEHFVLVSKLIVLFDLDAAQVVEVGFVANKSDARHLLPLECPLHEVIPILKVLKALVVGDIVAEQHGLRTKDIVPNHLAAYGLPTNVPHLQGDVDIARKHEPLHEEVDADRLLVLLCKLIACEAHGNRGFASGAVTQENHLVLQLFGFFF